VASASRGSSRTRGRVEKLPSGSLRVSVYAGIDPVSKKRNYLVETVPAGTTATRDAERVRTRLLNQLDERRNPRTKATVNQLLDRWLEVAEMETTTRNSVVGRLNRHVRPVLGAMSVGRLDAETLESFYAQLRRCRERCGGGRQAGHTCRPLAPATIRLIHANGDAPRIDVVACCAGQCVDHAVSAASSATSCSARAAVSCFMDASERSDVRWRRPIRHGLLRVRRRRCGAVGAG
jgi:hypothetical protein